MRRGLVSERGAAVALAARVSARPSTRLATRRVPPVRCQGGVQASRRRGQPLASDGFWRKSQAGVSPALLQHGMALGLPEGPGDPLHKPGRRRAESHSPAGFWLPRWMLKPASKRSRIPARRDVCLCSALARASAAVPL